MLSPTFRRGVLLLLFAASAAAPLRASEKKMANAARAFLASLGPKERAKAVMPFETDQRFDWHFTAKAREGLPLKEMSTTQRETATVLLLSALSLTGFDKAETVRRLEEVLRSLQGPHRDPEMYYFSLFGEPREKGVWGWRYEGHHLSLSFTVVDNEMAGTTPQFFGANPAEVKSGPLKGTRALGAEEDLARALVTSLSPEQSVRAITSETAPPEILTGTARTAALQDDVGIPYSALNQDQQARLVLLIEEHASAQRPDRAKERLDKIRAAGLSKVKLVWMGSLERGEGHYYRVQGPTFLIEYDNTQSGANHAHAVWRDFKGDWGADVLAQHYQRSPHHAAARKRARAGSAAEETSTNRR